MWNMLRVNILWFDSIANRDHPCNHAPSWIFAVTNIAKLSPTYFVLNIRHQHQCNPKFRYFKFWHKQDRSFKILIMNLDFWKNRFLSERACDCRYDLYCTGCTCLLCNRYDAIWYGSYDMMLNRITLAHIYCTTYM